VRKKEISEVIYIKLYIPISYEVNFGTNLACIQTSQHLYYSVSMHVIDYDV